MFRGGRSVQLPPLHGLPDVIGLLVLAALLAFLLAWFMGGRTLGDLASLLGPPRMATIVRVQVVLDGLPAEAAEELRGSLPGLERAIPSDAAALAERTAGRLLGLQEEWRSGSFEARRVKEAATEQAFEAVAHSHGTPGGGMLVGMVVLLTGRTVQLPARVTRETLAHVLKGLALLEPRHIGAVRVTCEAAAAEGLVAL